MHGHRSLATAGAALLIGLHSAADASPAAVDGDPLRLESLDLEQHRGKVVLVDFWASWCKPCVESFPWLITLQEEFAEEGLVVIGVNEDRRRDQADAFLRDHPPSFPVIFDPDGELAKQFGLSAMPSSFLFDRDGRRRLEHVGFHSSDREQLRESVRTLLSEGEKKPS